jgi:hypothetical protein
MFTPQGDHIDENPANKARIVAVPRNRFIGFPLRKALAR